MNLSISARDVEMTPAMYAYLAAKMQHVQCRCPQVVACHLLLAADAYVHTIEATLQQPDGSVAMTATGSTMYGAVDALARVMIGQAGAALQPVSIV